MRVLLAGDSHGNAQYIANLSHLAETRRCERIFVLGDFGMWEHYEWGRDYLAAVESIAVDNGLFIDFIDGNHDNHPMLWSMYGEAKGQQVRVRENVYYHGRGQRWQWDGVNFMSLGGGYSIDKDQRRPWTSWWPTECITDEDVTYSIRGGDVDVLLCHDSPGEVNLTTHGGHGAFKQGIAESEHNRELLQRVVNIKRPRLVVHGHMHINYVDTVCNGGTMVRGLAHDDAPLNQSTLVLELVNGRYLLG